MNEDFYTIFSGNLSRIMEKRGKTVKDLSERMGVSDVAAAGWCKGVCVPRLQKVPELCAWLNCSADDLLIAYEDGDSYGSTVRASWEEIAVIMAYRQATDERRGVVREILHIIQGGRRGKTT